jgi:hypothetical protein
MVYHAAQHPRCWGRLRHGLANLSLLAITALIAGCASSESKQSKFRMFEPTHRVGLEALPSEPADQAPKPQPDTTVARNAAEHELGADAASSMPVVSKPHNGPHDRGAEQLVNSISDSIQDHRIAGADGLTRIGLTQIHNQSRSDRTEFDSLLNRMAVLLSEAGAESHVMFVNQAEGQLDYQMQGTAYLISSGGFDVWELFLSIQPVERNFSVWRGAEPVHILRTPRPGEPQFLAPPH